ncbi:MAG TPA: hypothetical protein PKI63_02510 [Candidatus Cloacimonadota bacterium]|nr:hypothetical protein [Candidatus Cloacimonadota bacterium]
MPRPRCCLILLGLLVLSCGLDASGTYSFGRNSVPSMFSPQVSSQFDDNYSLYPYFLYYDPPLKAPQGISHPFSSFKRLGDSIVDAFNPANRRYALLQYTYRDSGMVFGSPEIALHEVPHSQDVQLVGNMNFRSELNFVAGYDQRWEDDTRYGFIWKGIALKANINKHIAAKAIWTNGAFTGDRDAAEALSPLVDGYITHTAEQTRLDNLTARLTYYHPNLGVELGRNSLNIGNNLSGSIVLSDQVNDYGYLRAEAMFGKLRVSLLHASLNADSARAEAKLADLDLPDKYLALHEIAWYSDLHRFYAGEAVVYGNRAPDINYLLPHTFWRVTEHNQWDRDNVLIYAGFSKSSYLSHSYWFTGLFDELSYGKLFSNWWGNKWAVQSGAEIYFPALELISLPPKLAVEVVAVRPWTYTHYQNHTMYSHDKKPLGYPKGSNLVSGTAELDYPLSMNFHLVGQASFTRQGSEGNDWRLNYSDYFPPALIDTARTPWFAGQRTDTLELGSLLKIYLAHHNLYIGHRAKKTDKWEHSVFAGWLFLY